MSRKLKILIISLVILITAALCFYIIARNPEEDLEPETITNEDVLEELPDTDNDVAYEEEGDGAEVDRTKSPGEASFIGSWTAESAEAAYLYGNISLTIKEDGTWKGNITGENISGGWTENEYGITLKSSLFNAKLFFAESGNLVLEDYRFEDNDEPILIVLSSE